MTGAARNPYAMLQPSQKMLALARADGVDSGNKAAFDRWLAERRAKDNGGTKR